MSTDRKVSRKITAIEKAYWRASDAREVLGLWRRSGASLAEFAREHDLCRHRLDRWRDRLEAEPTPPRFHRVRLVGPVESRPVAEGRTGGIEIVVSGGRRVTVRSGFDPDLLAEVVRVLEALAC
jgi:hypothetical protein